MRKMGDDKVPSSGLVKPGTTPVRPADSCKPSLRVTLACVDCVDPCAGARALWKSSRRLAFQDVVLFSHEKPGNLPPDIQYREIPHLATLDAYNLFMLRELWKHLGASSHILTVQSDGFVIHPELWDPTWLDYDYIGPPWEKLRTYAAKNRVGGSGFCLRSQRLLKETSDLATDAAIDKHRTMTGGPILDDIFTGWTHYDELVATGIRFAPVDVAAKFAFEHPTLEALTPENSFGFHGKHTEETAEFCEGVHIMVKPSHESPVLDERPILSILMPAMHNRDWPKMVLELRRQIGNRKDAELCVMADGGNVTSGWKRNRLLDMARGYYVAMVDDDDVVSEDYVDKLVAGCRSGLDVVTFDIMRIMDSKRTRQSFGLHNQDHRFVHGVEMMKANHLCAWRREIAIKVRYDERIGYADDQVWYKPLVAAFPELTEHHIAHVLYTYLFSWSVTANQQKKRREYTKQLYCHGANVYRRDGEVFVSDGTRPNSVIHVRDADGQRIPYEESMEYVTTIHVR